MSATNGSLRSRGRIIGLSLVVIVALSAIFASAASASFKPVQTTLALGDSLAFGYSAQTFNENLLTGDQAASFENGYANKYLALQGYKAHKIQLDNLGCPGETTDSFIGNGPLGSLLDPVEGEAPCAYHTVDGFPLHTEYGSGKSQLEAMLEQIGLNAFKGTPVTTITLNIGANDQLHAIAKCEAEVKSEINPEKGLFFSKYGGKTSSEEALGEAGEAGVDGAEAKIAFEKGEVALGAELAKEAEEDGKAAEADFYRAGEEAVKGCIEAHVEGLFGHIIKNVDTILYVLHHGKEFGDGVNYGEHGEKVVFQGGYDPYGRVYKTQAEVEAAKAVGPQFKGAKLGELLPGTVGLAAVLNGAEKKNLEEGSPAAEEEGHEVEHVCFAGVEGGAAGHPATAFNPGLGPEQGEKGTLQRFTNMNNQKVQEYPPELKIAPRPDGPDIHPTETGAHDLAVVMHDVCG